MIKTTCIRLYSLNNIQSSSQIILNISRNQGSSSGTQILGSRRLKAFGFSSGSKIVWFSER